MALPTPQEFIAKWQRRTQAAVPDYQAGVKSVTEAPGVKAAKQANAMLQGVTQAVSSGKWARRVADVPLQAWQDAAANIGAQRIAAGVAAAAPKMNEAISNLLADLQATMAEVERTPRGDLQTNIQRAVTQMQGMAARAAARK